MVAGLPPSLTDKAYAELEERIVTLELKPGQVLSENALAASLGIGRTPIREALQRLAREGLIVILPRRGVMVSEINVRSQLELLRVRRELERLMAKLASKRASADERTLFVNLAEEMRDCADRSDDVGFMRLDRDMNLMVSRACRNEYAQRAMGLTHGLSRRFWYMHYKEVLDLPRCATLHATLAQAIGEGETEGAMQASDNLLDYIESFTRAALDVPLNIA
ncbi:GntR family transcriptional regulator [Pacificispira sp.]|uniref:GntR family transcriptional regulator n=1 Tax=Pacificispira sp. TaxID=2888761 RepID=UPI003BA8EA18